jgi:hypothetical protein
VRGADVRFTDATTGTELLYEVETWDADTDIATVWVKVPKIDLGSATDYIYVYYNYDGEGAATYDQTTQNEQDVWNTNYAGVWHLDEETAGTGTADVYTDSTSNINHGDDQVAATGQDGKIAAGQQFNGSADYVDLGETQWDGSPDGNTYMFWFQKQGAGTVGTAGVEFILGKGAGNRL